MNRRKALKQVSYILGGTIMSSTLATVWSSCQTATSDGYEMELLSSNEGSILAEIVEVIIPTTDTPGAKEAGVHHFIDRYLSEILPEEAQNQFKEGLTKFEASCKEAYGKSFTKLSEEEKIEFMTSVADGEEHREFFEAAKSLTLQGYFSSEIGMTQVLQYEHVPGDFVGCVPLTEAGKGRTWAT